MSAVTSRGAGAPPSVDGNKVSETSLHEGVQTLEEATPSGFLARILRNVRDWPLAVKVSAIAIPVILEIADLIYFGCFSTPSLLNRAVWSVLAVAGPIFGLLEVTSLMNEVADQISKSNFWGEPQKSY